LVVGVLVMGVTDTVSLVRGSAVVTCDAVSVETGVVVGDVVVVPLGCTTTLLP